jgi:hypothetical protein
MNIDDYELKAIDAIKALKLVNEKQEDAYKAAVMHSYNAAIHLYKDGYYGSAIREVHWCADMAVKLFLWKKHMANYSDNHNLPMHRILNWFPDDAGENMKHVVVDLKQVHQLFEQFGNYMEMVEEHQGHLYSTKEHALFDVTVDNKDAVLHGAKEAIVLVDRSLVTLLDFG